MCVLGPELQKRGNAGRVINWLQAEGYRALWHPCDPAIGWDARLDEQFLLAYDLPASFRVLLFRAEAEGWDGPCAGMLEHAIRTYAFDSRFPFMDHFRQILGAFWCDPPSEHAVRASRCLGRLYTAFSSPLSSTPSARCSSSI